MITIYYRYDNKICSETDYRKIFDIDYLSLLWIDLTSPSEEIKEVIETYLQISLQTRQQVEEIESSSRYLETDQLVIANSNFLIIVNETYINEPVSLLVKDKILISIKNSDLKSFVETVKKLEANPKNFATGYHILVALFETRIDKDADTIEHIVRQISLISKNITIREKLSENIIYDITKYQETTMMIRENIIDKQRVISGILKSERFPDDTYPKLRIMIKDISSLLDYTIFNFERLEYLQDTFLALINMEQNKIIKLFTVASVIFMPPTLIASIYGMNFKILPELNWTYGYWFALGIMVLSSVSTLVFFRRKKWL